MCSESAKFSRRFEQRLAGVVEFLHALRHVAPGRPEPLRVVIEVRQVDEREVRLLVLQGVRGVPGDPLGTRRAGHRPPELREGKCSEFALQET